MEYSCGIILEGVPAGAGGHSIKIAAVCGDTAAWLYVAVVGAKTQFSDN